MAWKEGINGCGLLPNADLGIFTDVIRLTRQQSHHIQKFRSKVFSRTRTG